VRAALIILLVGGVSLSCASGNYLEPPFNGPFRGVALRKQDQPRLDCEYLMMHLSARVKEMLTSRAEYLPVGSAMSPAGEVIDVSGVTGGGPHKETSVVAALEERFRQGAKEGRYKATALVVHMRVTPQAPSGTQEAIAYRWDHRDAYSTVLVFPYYYLPDGSLKMEQSFFILGENRIFTGGAAQPAAGQ
jgi:hypothetical protein